MTITTGKPGVADVVAEVAKSDEGTARLMVEMLTYDALCEEIDRVRPALDRETSQVLAKRAEGALQHIAKRYSGASPAERLQLEEMAEGICELVGFSKATDDDPSTPWWDARDDKGEFTSRAGGPRGQAYRTAANALKIFAGRQDADTKRVMGDHLNQIAQGDKYSRARALGQGLQQISNPHAQAAGTLTRMIGDIGPEAQRVFGHGLTRLAYRFRGTERRPNPQYRQAVQGRLSQLQAEGKLTDQTRLRAISDLGAGFLYPQVPNQHLAELSLKAGRMPPSRGIIFDAQGNPVVEAMGYNGDHYLPFDLKNLKRLRGGQYVRTRTTGGLTDEDIYTGLMTGARNVTVVSNSGVFSIEFDPSLRGGRRYNDKARQMVDRYASLVETIGSGNAIAQDLTPQEKAAIRQEAYDKANGSETLARQYVKELEQKARFKSQFTSRDDEELMHEAHSQAVAELKGKPGGEQVLARRQNDIFRDLRTQERDKAVRTYRLDGEGYKAAQDALAQEFPYFIRAQHYQPLDRWLASTGRLKPTDALPPRPGRDIGYTRRNQLGPNDTSSAPKKETEAKGGEGKPGEKKAETAADTTSATWGSILSSPDSPVRADLADALDRSLKVRAEITGLAMPPEGDITDSEALSLDWDQYASWLLTSKGGAGGTAKFLTSDTTDPRHIDKTAQAVKHLRATGNTAYDGFDKAEELLGQVKLVRQPFAQAAKDPILASPDQDNPAPQPIAEITDLGPNLRKLQEYATANPDVAKDAQELLAAKDDTGAAADIRADLRRIHAIQAWPRDDAGKPDEGHTSSVGITYDEVRQYEDNPTQFPTYLDLERRQKAWTLARATRLAALSTGSQVPDLVPKEGLGKRSPLPRRIVMHGPGSPVAKALAELSKQHFRH